MVTRLLFPRRAPSRRPLALLLALGLAGAVQAQEAPEAARPAPDCPPLSPCRALPAEQLDELRGGFDRGGLQVSFGLERLTYVNDQLVARSAVELPDLRRITPEQAAEFSAEIGRVQLVQNGPGNVFVEPPAGSVLAGTVIQNTLNDQAIRHLTTLNATANSLQFLKNMNLQSVLQEALAAPLGLR